METYISEAELMVRAKKYRDTLTYFVEYIYNNSSLFLTRKYNIYENINI